MLLSFSTVSSIQQNGLSNDCKNKNGDIRRWIDQCYAEADFPLGTVGICLGRQSLGAANSVMFY
jgi:hypothetical protein